jgi:alpha-L-rhamnosidase
MKRRDFLLAAGLSPLVPVRTLAGELASVNPSPAEQASSATNDLVAVAESLKPALRETAQRPLLLVRPVAAPAAALRWRMETESPAAGLAERVLKKGDTFILDFGGHRTGYLSFRLLGVGRGVDAPARLRFTFGEVPTDVAEPLYPYKGGLSSAWLPDEVVNVDDLPQDVRLPRRYAFRYVKVEVLDTSPNFGVQFQDVQAHAVTSAAAALPPLPAGVPEDLRRIDEVAAATLRDCMQTTFEDGPRRDQRLWTGDLRVQALTNYATFNNTALVKRSLYLLAAFPREDGSIPACVFEKPVPAQGHEYIADYAVLYGVAVHEYVRATGDVAAGRALWPTVKRQLELVGRYVNAAGLFADPGKVWIFIDWNRSLDRTASMHGVLLYGYRQAAELARLLGLEGEVADYPERIARMTAAARAAFYDPTRGVFVSGPQRQVSLASQAWLSIAGVPTQAEGAAALSAALKMPDVVRARTPYLNHYVVDALLLCGLRDEARLLVRSYWGGMVAAGADTFWEAYAPEEPLLSPYGDPHINSYCHAWSCTPSYFIRSRGLA